MLWWRQGRVGRRTSPGGGSTRTGACPCVAAVGGRAGWIPTSDVVVSMVWSCTPQRKVDGKDQLPG